MTFVDAPPVGRASMHACDVPDEFVSCGRSMIETTEVRWFADGALPPAVWKWFTRDGALGVVEQRCDLYWSDGRHDVGVKLRAQSTLELKIRQSSVPSAPAIDDAGEQLRGAVEVWRKWSPADGLVSRAFEPAIEVRKTIVKRRFSITGEEHADPALVDPLPGPFCDAEIVAVDDGVSTAWSLALGAQGPRPGRTASIDAAWRAIALPTAWTAVLTTSCGYPEWLHGRIGVDSPVTER